jgi:hypothetical protein
MTDLGGYPADAGITKGEMKVAVRKESLPS